MNESLARTGQALLVLAKRVPAQDETERLNDEEVAALHGVACHLAHCARYLRDLANEFKQRADTELQTRDEECDYCGEPTEDEDECPSKPETQ